MLGEIVFGMQKQMPKCGVVLPNIHCFIENVMTALDWPLQITPSVSK
jgi:hypothetical protein